jgi:DNA-binding NarL/FixJ family response regulator
MAQSIHNRKAAPNASLPVRHRIFLIDDHTLFREGIKKMLAEESDLLVCGEAANAREVSQRIDGANPHLILVDISLPGIDGLELIKTLKAEHDPVYMIVLSMHPEELYAERVIRAGASGYIMKHASAQDLLSAIRMALRGDIYLSSSASTRLLKSIAVNKGTSKSDLHALSDREIEILRVTGQGYTTREISDALHISVKTVESHRGNIRRKLAFKTGAELTRFALAHRSDGA